MPIYYFEIAAIPDDRLPRINKIKACEQAQLLSASNLTAQPRFVSRREMPAVKKKKIMDESRPPCQSRLSMNRGSIAKTLARITQ